MSAARKTLEKRLGDFLGFDDGVADVLDHLLTIDTSSDLMDYLEQLLGSKDEKVKAFVQDISRFQKGLPIDEIDFGKSEEEESKANKEPQPPASSSASDKKKPHPANNQNTKPSETANISNKNKQAVDAASTSNTKTIPKKQQQDAKTPPKAASAAAAAAAASVDKKDGQSKQSTPSQLETPKKKFAPPPKGKAKRNCGCFGTLHKPLTNCLYCGRIACDYEGYDFCPFCGFLVEEVKPPEGESDGSKARAWQHKERLLRYDREFTKRTQVLDDQADYYSNQTSTWLTEDERIEAEEKDDEQRTDLHTRKKQVLNIAF